MSVDNKIVLYLDFETYYADDYTLRDMTPAEYILDDRFEAIMLAAKIEDYPGFIVDGPDIPRFLAKFDTAVTATVTFNALFDNAILAWRYNWIPSLMLDSMGMARALMGHKLKSHSLKAVARELGLPDKGDAIVKVKGLHRSTIAADLNLWREFKSYAMRDNDLSAGIFGKLIDKFPWAERRLQDLVLRCTIQPQFQLDEGVLAHHLITTRDRKRELMKTIGLDYERILEGSISNPLMSGAKFQAMLEERGVEVQTKLSPGGGSTIPAFAKTDQFMADLLDHDDPVVQALAEARLAVKSTIDETRCARMIQIARLPWERYRHGKASMPIPLAYGAAHTHRLGGTWGLNMQNLPRNAKGKPSQLRRALTAPEGHYIIAGDLKQIEARLAAWLAKCGSQLRAFASGEDLYASFASEVFGFKVDALEHPIHRFIGKTGILGLGYQCSAQKFFHMVVTSARLMGIDLGALNFTEALARKTVDQYREKYEEFPAVWARLGAALYNAWARPDADAPTVAFGPTTIAFGSVALPNGMYLRYDPIVEFNSEGRAVLSYRYGKEVRHIYGAKVFENIVQALARIIVMNAALRIYDQTGLPFALQAHDELVYVVRQKYVDIVSGIIQTEMKQIPSWGNGLPLDVDVSKPARSYGEAK